MMEDDLYTVISYTHCLQKMMNIYSEDMNIRGRWKVAGISNE